MGEDGDGNEMGKQVGGWGSDLNGSVSEKIGIICRKMRLESRGGDVGGGAGGGGGGGTRCVVL